MMRTDVSLEATRTDAWMSAMAITPAQARSASLILADHADHADELRLWLEILGLLPYEPGAQRTACGRRSTAKRDPDDEPPPAPTRRCGACGHLVTAESHKAVCDA